MSQRNISCMQCNSVGRASNFPTNAHSKKWVIFEQNQTLILLNAQCGIRASFYSLLCHALLTASLPLLLACVCYCFFFSSVSCIPQKIPKIPPTITMKAIVNTIATHIIIGSSRRSAWELSWSLSGTSSSRSVSFWSSRLTQGFFLALVVCSSRPSLLRQCCWCQFQTCLLQLE